MRIVHANKAYSPHIGGIETVVQDLAEGAVARGHEVEVVAAGEAGRRSVDGVDVRCWRSFGSLRSVPLSPGLLAGVARARADVVHVHVPSVVPEVALAAVGRRRAGVLAVSLHAEVVRQRALRTAYVPALRRLLGLADLVFVATPRHVDGRELLRPFLDKVRVVPYGLDLERYARTDEVDRRVEQLHERYGHRFVLAMGRLVYYKGVRELLAVADRLDVPFVVVGAGPLAGQVEESDAARAGRLTRLDPVDHAEKVALLHACSVFAFPSTHTSEAYGIVQVEAMGCGAPVVGFDLPTGVTWVNRHDETGLVVPLGDVEALGAAIASLLGDEPLRARLGRQAADRVARELTLDGQIDATLAAYREALPVH